MSKGFEGIGWLWRRIDPSEGPGMWHHSVNAELMGLLRDRDDHDVRELAFADETRQLAEQRAELLDLVDAIARGRAHCFIPTDDPSRPTFNWDERAEAAIANATQQRNATGGEG